ncbi:MAG: hypothetical protein HQM08_10550 [Candidatus Riflebacteria bacterium]|nr:hypothetical protein [Candidatus Riflebacteria bacterium]
MKLIQNRSGMGFFILIALAAIFGILIVMMFSVQSNQVLWLSKNEKDFFSNTVAEAALNIALGELEINPCFRTAWHVRTGTGGKLTWESPVKSYKPSFENCEDLSLAGVNEGVYSGSTRNGMFKFKLAPFFGAKENKNTKSLKEASMFVRCEIVACVGTHGSEKEDSYRRITAILEKRCPIYEYLLFDGELLDLGYGPYDTPNIFRGGRLYGYQWITFNTSGSGDQGSDLKEIEKIETPGMIRALKDTKVDFLGKVCTTFGASNDSGKPGKLQSLQGFALDEFAGGRAYKVHDLSSKTYLEKAKYLSKFKKGGFIVEEDSFPKSNWKNPYDTDTTFYDIDFGEPNYRDVASHSTSPDDEGDDSSASSDDDDNENSAGKLDSDPPKNGDDGGRESPLTKVRGKKVLIYSKFPLRIWGCPDRTTTIFCEKDIVIAGDFNQTPTTIQDYPDANFIDYKTPIKNGRQTNSRVFNKVGALLISQGRIIIDHSRPTLFAKNEMKPYFLYLLGMTLGPNESGEKYLLEQVCPADPANLKEINGGGQSDPSGNSPTFKVIDWMLRYSNTISTGPLFLEQIASISNFFTPSTDGSPRFGIQNSEERQKIIDLFVGDCKKGGILKVADLNEIFENAWKVAVDEEEKSPKQGCGAMGLMNGLFDLALKTAKSGKFTIGIHPPEITINASLVSSTRRSSAWKIGSTGPKVFDEVGNVESTNPAMIEYLKTPRFVIQRVFGSEIRLGTAEPTYFLSGVSSGRAILRRRIWDKSLAGGDYQPPALFYTHDIMSMRDDLITKKDFDSF